MVVKTNSRSSGRGTLWNTWVTPLKNVVTDVKLILIVSRDDCALTEAIAKYQWLNCLRSNVNTRAIANNFTDLPAASFLHWESCRRRAVQPSTVTGAAKNGSNNI